MKSRTILVEKPDERQAQLAELGLSESVLIGALTDGLQTSFTCTKNHPPNYAGISMWAETVRGLRDRLKAEGWRADDTRNFSLVVRGDGKVAVAVAGGDGLTGDPNPDSTPSSRYPKGKSAEDAVRRNACPYLPYDPPWDAGGQLDDMQTWYLLHHRQKDMVLCELSLPTSIDLGFFDEWQVRILLTPISLDPIKLPIPADEPVNPEITVKVRDNIS